MAIEKFLFDHMTQFPPILLNDPDIPGYLDFDALRILGRDHIAKLSGTIWSDHNVHDPGITIMEVLVYAIMDLGYRNQLPDEELFAQSTSNDLSDDNFFTAAQILSCNPLTVNDFRKLILEVKGVRNAWLEISEESELPLGINCEESELEYADGNDKNLAPLRIKGLYRVCLELESREILNLIKREEGTIIKEVRQILLEHRNLGEDFIEISVLGEQEIGVCADIEITSNADPEETMVKVMEVISRFLSPTIPYYTLEQLLAKGKTMDEIFEGRPLRMNGHGFIDTEDLETSDRITEIYISDLYQKIIALPEVRGIKEFALQGFIDGDATERQPQKWCLKIKEKHRPVLSTSMLDITFYKNVLPFTPDKRKAVDRFKKRLSNVEKAQLQPYQRDFSPPLGKFRQDLADYRSIQHDFPVVYGIGEGHLSPSATNTRQAQALQLKGYLLFFDQLLTNYLGQLANIRNLFAHTPEAKRKPENKRTYFAQPLSDVPKVEQLIRFYDEESTSNLAAEKIAFWLGDIDELLKELTAIDIPERLGLPLEDKEKFLRQYPDKLSQFFHLSHKDLMGFIKLPTSPERRDSLLQDIVADFSAGKISLEIQENFLTKELFVVARNRSGKPVLKSPNYCKKREELEAVLDDFRIFGGLPEAYRSNFRILEKQKKFTFDLVRNALNYWTYLNQIQESQEDYFNRRNVFLNHLLARFAEHFTDYVLLMFALNGRRHDMEKIVHDKSNFLSQYPEISRNRGRGFNYGNPKGAWNTDNISGFEKRLTAMLGIPDFKRHSLSNFEIVGRSKVFRYRIYADGVAIFHSAYAYETKGEAEHALKDIYDLAKSVENYEKIDCCLLNAFTFKLVASPNNGAIHLGAYPSADARDQAIQSLTTALKPVINITPAVTTIDPTIRLSMPTISTNPPGTDEQPPSVDDALSYSRSSENPIAQPDLYSGNIYVKTEDRDFLYSNSINGYRLVDENNLCAQYPNLLEASQHAKVRSGLLKNLDHIDQQYSALCMGASKVVHKTDGKYYFHLVDQRKDTVLWRSHEGFQGAEQAYEAFRLSFFKIVELARSARNFIEVKDPEGQTVQLLLSKKREILAEVPPEALSEGTIEEIKTIRLLHAQRFPIRRSFEIQALKKGVQTDEEKSVIPCPESTEEQDRFGFLLYSLAGDSIDWISTGSNSNPEDAWFGFLRCLELIKNDENWLKVEDPESDKVIIGIGEILLESQFHYAGKANTWQGNKDFTDHFKEEGAFSRFTDFWNNCKYSFQVTSRDFRLAVHPYQYNTSIERGLVLDCLRKSAMQWSHPFTKVVVSTPPQNNNSYPFYWIVGTCYWNKKDDGNDIKEKLWQVKGKEPFVREDEVKKAFRKQHIAIMNLAREAKNYSFKEGNGKCVVELLDKFGKMVAQIPEEVDLSNQNKRLIEIEKRVRCARAFPIIETPLGYRFEIYDFNFDHRQLLRMAAGLIQGNSYDQYCIPPPNNRSGSTNPLQEIEPKLSRVKTVSTKPWEFTNPSIVENEPIAEATGISDCKEEEKQLMLKHIKEKVRGGIVWESIRTFNTLEKVQCVVDWLADKAYLFRQLDSYYLTQKENTNCYSFELVNPEEVLAISPRQFTLASDCASAMERARTKINVEGLHLIEHVLLRPVKKTVDTDLVDLGFLPENMRSKNRQEKDKKSQKIRYSETDPIFLQQAGNKTSNSITNGLLPIRVEPDHCEKVADSTKTDDGLFDYFIRGADPYSFQVSIIIPYWPQRFQNIDFRTFFESTVLRELPAYVVPRIIWSNPEDLKKFEYFYQAWLSAKSKFIESQLDETSSNETIAEASQAKENLEITQRRLIYFLFQEMINEFPSARFQGGGAVTEGPSRVVLEKTMLL